MNEPSERAPRAVLHLGFAVLLVAADYLLTAFPFGSGYGGRAIAALVLWNLVSPRVPLSGELAEPRYNRLSPSMVHVVIVALGVGGLALAVGVTSRWLGLEGTLAPLVVSDVDAAWSFLFHACLAAPIVEEFIYRGLVYPRLRVVLGARGAIFLVGLLFWGAHWAGAGGATPVNQLAAGWLLAWSYERTRSLIAPTILHALGNLSLLALDLAWLQEVPAARWLLGEG